MLSLHLIFYHTCTKKFLSKLVHLELNTLELSINPKFPIRVAILKQNINMTNFAKKKEYLMAFSILPLCGSKNSNT